MSNQPATAQATATFADKIFIPILRVNDLTNHAAKPNRYAARVRQGNLVSSRKQSGAQSTRLWTLAETGSIPGLEPRRFQSDRDKT
jgi:hypothetical protein